MKSGRWNDSRDSFEKAQSLRQDILDKHSDCAEIRRDMARGCYNMARLCSSQPGPDLEGAEANCEKAISLFDQLRQQNPRDLENRHRLAASCWLLADVQSGLRNVESARGLYQRSIGLMKELAEDNHKVASYQADLAGVKMNFGQLEAEEGHDEKALNLWREAAEILQELIGQYPDPRYRRDLAQSHRAIGILELDRDHTEQARDHLQKARSHLEKLPEKSPNYQADLARVQMNFGLLEAKEGHDEEALNSWREAVEILQRLVEQHRAVDGYRFDLALSQWKIGMLLGGYTEQARNHLQEARTHLEKLTDDFPGNDLYDQLLQATVDALEKRAEEPAPVRYAPPFPND
jgi:tetratricopeptide (TPR) repeat protein